MNADIPVFLTIPHEAFETLGEHFDLPTFEGISDIADLYVWGIETVFLYPLDEYMAHYQTLTDAQTGVKFVLGSIILNCLVLETDFEPYQESVLKNILLKDYHVHESLLHWWASFEVAPEDYRADFVNLMRSIFAHRCLTKIVYTFETPENHSFYYDCYKISCFEHERGIFGSIEIRSKQTGVWHEDYFQVSDEQWQTIKQLCNQIGVPYTINRYHSHQAYTGNHILELYNVEHTLFYKLNWFANEPNDSTPTHNFKLKDLLLEMLTEDTETLAQQAFPVQLDFNKMSEIEIFNYNSGAWDAEFKFLEEVIFTRFSLHTGTTTKFRSVYEVPLPRLDAYSHLGRLVAEHNLGFEARVILAMAMAVHLRPQSLDEFFTRNQKYDRTYSEAGGLKGKFHSGYLPTLETVYFLLAGKDISKRLQIYRFFFDERSFFIKNNVLKIEVKEATEPTGAGQLVMSNEYLTYLTTGKTFKPSYTNNFPAELLTTELEWSDLFLEKETMTEIKNIETWLAYQHTIMHDLGLKKHLKLGYRALFYGSSGTGKTLTATLLGKHLGLDVYRVDLSMISSKYIGETTKNLARLFDMAENKHWILFFDEAESLFGKRSQTVERATDAYYNQEVGYLLQRIENYDGLVVLATNLLDNIDTAFMRRFQSLVYFPVPSAAQQLALWQNIFAVGLPLAKNVKLKTLSEKYTLTASNITNVLRYATIQTLQKQNKNISMQTLTEAIEKELKKVNLREKVGF